ncbi:MAG: phosphoribosylanthranilate isomerase [Iamia sp.]
MFVKICGITSEEDALLAVAMDADALGFNFAPSIRRIAPVVARDIVKRLPPEIITVGIFQDEAPERVVSIVNQAGLRAAQLSGRESADTTQFIAQRVPMVIKAFAAGTPELSRARDHGVEVVMLDGKTPGGGQTFDWSLATDVPPGLKVVLAGGLRPDNVAQAVAQVRPWGVDVASGVERDGGTPGEKDPRKVRLFVANARAAAAQLQHEPDVEPYDWTDDTLS